MQILKTVWDFFQNQILGMRWLNELIESGLLATDLDTKNRWVGSAQFFLYDVTDRGYIAQLRSRCGE